MTGYWTDEEMTRLREECPWLDNRSGWDKFLDWLFGGLLG